MKRVVVALALLFATPAFAVDPTGVPECDALLKKYEGCTIELPPKKVHDAQKELLDAAMGMRAGAQNPAARADLVRYCNDTYEQMKKASDIKECMSKP